MSTSSVSKGLKPSSSVALRMEEEAKVAEQQGIRSILGSDDQPPKTAPSLRRTLSADMSSKSWLAQHGFSHLKKTASSEGFLVASSIIDSSSSSASEEDDDEESKKELQSGGQFDIWNSIQSEQAKKDLERPGQFDIWSSILSQKSDNGLNASAPYVHPLVKRSTSSLSEKSLEICTESLGSETGSDGFSSHPPSESSDVEENPEEETAVEEEEEHRTPVDESETVDKDEFGAVNYNFSIRKSPPRSFPPPLPSLSRRDGPSVYMRPHRRDGRLVLEAVPIVSHNYFRAERQDGRLLLSFTNNTPHESPSTDVYNDNEEMNLEEEQELRSEEHEEEEKEDETKEIDDVEESKTEEEIERVEEEVRDRGIVMEVKISHVPPRLSTTGVMNMHRSTLVMNKLVALTNKNPTWSHKKGRIIDLEQEVEPTPPVPQSLQPPPRVARLIPTPAAAVAASFNPYDYCWRTKPAAKPTIHPLSKPPPSPVSNNNKNKFFLYKNYKPNEQPQMVLMRGNKGDYLLPILAGCKETRRSLLMWEPYCIAIS
ncbi:PREDICTED: protein FAF-like, chloroplastic [Nelumbo nucifera]|uniref:Protein FAF-like, chloroplastic n=1 Tax=Nelumbo nucifera TaxID=4432 RepID=A0A1U8ACA3_NELNU|nr:PREDICTED: protein FAF-like, chloroplastic [Nelumbo nucifera]